MPLSLSVTPEALSITLCCHHADQHFFFLAVGCSVVMVVIVWVNRHQWVAGFISGWLGCGSLSHSVVLSLSVTPYRRHTDQHFFFSCCGLRCGDGCGCVGRSASVGGWVGLWVDRCVRGGGSGRFRGGGCGCCLVGLVYRCVLGGGSAWLIFFFLCCGLWWWLWLCVCGYDVCV